MAKRSVVLASVLVVGLSTTALAGGKLEVRTDLLPRGQQDLLNDPPVREDSYTQRGIADTVWFGGEDVDGLAFKGDRSGGESTGIWDFEDGTLQGWSSEDKTDVGQADPPGDPSTGGDTYFRRITAADFSGATTIPVMSGVGSLWAGANDEEAAAGCWPGGLGYDNGWGVNATKTFIYGGTSTVTLQFDYFTDCETQFDYVYVYTDVAGVRSTPLNGSAWSTPEGWGYSGAQEEGTWIGDPTNPATDTIVIDLAFLPPDNGDPFQVIFNFDSDPLYSDGLDSFSGFLNSFWGPFGMDNFVINGVGLSDTDNFEVDEEGWTFSTDPAIGNFQQVVALASLDPIADDCACPITLDVENDFVMVAADWDGSIAGGFPHPQKQRELLISNPAVVTGEDDARAIYLLDWDVWEDTPTSNGVGYRASMGYWPWTCPETDEVGWTIEPAGDGGFIFSGLGGARCVSLRADNSEFMTTAFDNGVDSLKIVFELLGDCDDFGTANCTGPDQTNQSPYWDNLSIGLAGDPVDAPQISTEIIWQDQFPDENSLLPTATASVHSYYDNNRADTDQTNANMGDSATVLTASGAEVYLNYRLYRGPAMSDGDVNAFLGESGAGPNGIVGAQGGIGDAVADQGNGEDGNGRFASCEMTELDPGVNPGLFSTYSSANGNKILPDGELTPGSTVEYFFSVVGSSFPDQVRVTPDTTNNDTDPDTFFFLEFEVLPGNVAIGPDDGGQDNLGYLSSCVLYVDAFNFGAQVPLEDEGLRPRLGTTTDRDGIVHDNWDRYDYIAASSNVPAPLARESSGDNGMTKYQSLIYRTMLYNTGTFAQEGLRDGDADLIATWLTVARPGGSDFTRGLWLSGNGIASILNRTDRTDNNALLNQFAQTSFIAAPYRENRTGGVEDPSLCVRLDADPSSDVSAAGSYSSARGNGCPTEFAFDVIGAVGDGQGDLIWVDQDNGEVQTPYASVSNDQSPTSTGYRTVLDAFSIHYLRATPAGWTGDGDPLDAPGDGTPCADYAILARLNDVFDYLEAPTNTTVMKSFDGLIVGADEVVSPGVRTALYQNSPNPFNPRTTVRYVVGREAHVSLGIYDVNGRLVRTLVNEVQAPNTYSLQWDGLTDAGAKVSSGVYWARMSTSDGFDASTKMVVLK